MRRGTRKRWIVRSCLSVVAALSMSTGLLVAGAGGAPASGIDVIADDEIDQYSGSGAVILPSSISAASRWQAATCPGCRWKVTMPCQREDGYQDAGCRGILLGCPQGREIKRAWLALPGRDFEPVGLFCPSDGEAVSVADATSAVRGAFAHRLPPLRPACQPRRRVVVGIPVHCRSGQSSGTVSWSDELVGFTVRTSAQARWEWMFQGADGRRTRQESVIPGGAYPAPGIRHAFASAGTSRIQVRATWRGEFFVDGLGPFPISPDLHQGADITVPTGSALGVIRH